MGDRNANVSSEARYIPKIIVDSVHVHAVDSRYVICLTVYKVRVYYTAILHMTLPHHLLLPPPFLLVHSMYF
jgi:hypothetical protein